MLGPGSRIVVGRGWGLAKSELSDCKNERISGITLFSHQTSRFLIFLAIVLAGSQLLLKAWKTLVSLIRKVGLFVL